jgi:hypothetical protein
MHERNWIGARLPARRNYAGFRPFFHKPYAQEFRDGILDCTLLALGSR